jgi:threonine synthase
MDVGSPSNMERLRSVGGEANELTGKVRAFSVSDDEIRSEIRAVYDEFSITCCPHTATAFRVWHGLEPTERAHKDWILVATAHAAKFEQIVEPIIGETVPVPAELGAILSRERRFKVIEATSVAFAKALADGFVQTAAD